MEKRAKAMLDIVPAEWDNVPISLIHELRERLETIVDADTSIDSGGGDGFADMSLEIGGRRYLLMVERLDLIGGNNR